MKRPLPNWKQLACMAAGGIVAAVVYTLLTGGDAEGPYAGTVIGVGVALGAIPYLRTMQRFEANKAATETAATADTAVEPLAIAPAEPAPGD